MSLRSKTKRYGGVFLEAAPARIWPLYFGIGVCLVWLSVLTVSVVSLTPDATTAEVNEISAALELVGWLAIFYMAVPFLAGLTGVVQQAWRDVL